MKKFILGLFIGVFIFFVGAVSTYFIFFKPTIPTTSVNTPITINDWNLTKKFIPKDIDLSFTGFTAKSDATLSTNELTDLFISAIKESPAAMEYITGLQIVLENNTVSFYVNFSYKGIPLQAHLVFQCMASNGKGIFHYKDGNIGFIKLSKSMLFKNLTGNSFVQFNNEEGDIILNFTSIRNLDVQALTSNNGNLNIKFEYTVKFWDWIKDLVK